MKDDNIGEEEAQMPLGVGDESPADEYVEKRRSMPNTSTLSLVAAFAAAIVVLYLLGLLNKPRTFTADEMKHATEVEENRSDHRAIVGSARRAPSSRAPGSPHVAGRNA